MQKRIKSMSFDLTACALRQSPIPDKCLIAAHLYFENDKMSYYFGFVRDDAAVEFEASPLGIGCLLTDIREEIEAMSDVDARVARKKLREMGARIENIDAEFDAFLRLDARVARIFKLESSCPQYNGTKLFNKYTLRGCIKQEELAQFITGLRGFEVAHLDCGYRNVPLNAVKRMEDILGYKGDYSS
ncbi:hypothetical protein HY489_01665 [Candidatus Woesearchaeota archaeon]|nr:hypothetical protein [Candidatus Woesearchaeota archaeon]